MKKRSVVVAGLASAAVLIGAGTTAYATSELTDSAPSATKTTQAKKTTKTDHRRPAEVRALHAVWVTKAGKAKGGGFLTHDEVRGTVTAASSHSITVRALDGFTQTYQVNGKTKVREVASKSKGANASIAQVHPGLRARVVGTGPANAPTALRIHFWIGKASNATS
jgi:hypothetical protein